MSAVKITMLVIACWLLGTTLAIAQDYELPDQVTLKSKEDYARHATTLIEVAKWLEKTDLDKETDKRMRFNAFVIQYISGSADVHVEINDAVMSLVDKNEQLLALYLASYGRYALEHTGAPAADVIRAALTSVATVYKKGIAVNKNKELDKVAGMSEEELIKYVRKRFKTN